MFLNQNRAITNQKNILPTTLAPVDLCARFAFQLHQVIVSAQPGCCSPARRYARLFVRHVSHVTGCKDSLAYRLGCHVYFYFVHRVHLHEMLDEITFDYIAYFDEQSVYRQFPARFCVHVFHDNGRYELFTLYLNRGTVQNKFDLLVLFDFVYCYFICTECITSVYNVNFCGEFSKQLGRFYRRIAAAYYGNSLVLEYGRIARRARAYTASYELVLARYAEASRHLSVSQYKRARLVFLAVRERYLEPAFCLVDFACLACYELRAVRYSLLLEQRHQFGSFGVARSLLGETWIVLYVTS